jgi:hypothetical protein
MQQRFRGQAGQLNAWLAADGFALAAEEGRNNALAG